MASSIQAVLLYQGHALQVADTTVLTEVWLSQNLRPDLSVTYLPALGDTPLISNVISGQTALGAYGSLSGYDSLSGVLASLHCKSINEQEYIEGSSRGTLYTVQYDDLPLDSESGDPTKDETVVVLNIASGSEVVSYYPRKDANGVSSDYIYTDTGALIEDVPITKVIGVTNVSTTKRYRNKTAEEMIAMGAQTGKVNDTTMWGQQQGNILFTGVTAVPIQEYEKLLSTRKINWNLTNNYQIKYIPTVSADTWQYIWYKGAWTRIYNDEAHTEPRDLYDYGTIPNDLTLAP